MTDGGVRHVDHAGNPNVGRYPVVETETPARADLPLEPRVVEERFGEDDVEMDAGSREDAGGDA